MNPSSTNSKIVPMHPEANHDAQTQPPRTATLKQTTIPAPVPERLAKPPSISVHLNMKHIVFLITDLQELPELDTSPVEKCTMRFRLLPGLLLGPQQRQIVCPLLLDGLSLPAKVQLLLASMENENPFYGLSMFAKVIALPEYMKLVPPEISARLPYELVQELFPDAAAGITITDNMIPRPEGTELTPTQAATLRQQVPIEVNFVLPVGHPLPELYRGKTVRISLSLHTRTGGLALNDRSVQLINSRSHPIRIQPAATGSEPSADVYYQLRGTGSTLPITSSLPDFYEDYTEMLDPNAAYLARQGIGL